MSTDVEALSSGLAGVKRSGKAVLALHGAGYAGTERHVRSLAEGLHRRGWDIELVSSQEGPLLDAVRQSGVHTNLVLRTSTASYLRGLIRLLRKLRPALVHAHSGLLPALAARWAGVRTVIETRHGLPGRLNDIPGCSVIAQPGERWSWRLADRTLAVCAADAAWLTRNLGVPSQRINVIANGLPLASSDQQETAASRIAMRCQWGVEEDSVVLGFVGRLSKEKSPDRLLELLAWLEEQGEEDAPVYVLVIAGEGPELGRLKALAAAMHLEHHIRWLGVVPDAARILPGIDHLLLPSLYEGMPYVVLEALQAGVPVTATPVGGLPEVMKHGTLAAGLLAWSPKDWGRRILCLDRDRVNREAWREAAISRSADFDEERMLDQIEKVYCELLRV